MKKISKELEALERLKENSDYALMFVDNVYCLVDTKDNNFDVIDTYKDVIDNETQKKLKALDIIKEMEMLSVYQYYKGIYYLVVNNLAIEITKEKYDLLKEVLSYESNND